MSPVVSNVGEKVGYSYAYRERGYYCGVARMNVHLQLCGRSLKELGNKGVVILRIDKRRRSVLVIAFSLGLL